MNSTASNSTAAAGPDRLKPEGGLYAQARAAWSGPARSIDALENGQQFLTKHPDEVADDIANLSPSEKEFYRLGARNTLLDKVASAGPNADESQRIANSDFARQRLRPLFDNDADYTKFTGAVQDENRMAITKYRTLGNSLTGARVAEDQSSGHTGAGANALQTALDLGHGNVPGALYAGARTIASLMRNGGDPRVAAAAARALTETDPAARSALLARMMQPPPVGPQFSGLPLAAAMARLPPSLLTGSYLPRAANLLGYRAPSAPP